MYWTPLTPDGGREEEDIKGSGGKIEIMEEKGSEITDKGEKRKAL